MSCQNFILDRIIYINKNANIKNIVNKPSVFLMEGGNKFINLQVVLFED
jgi:hypothetical protein